MNHGRNVGAALLDELEALLGSEKCDSQRDVGDGKEEQAEERQNHHHLTESHRQAEGREHQILDEFERLLHPKGGDKPLPYK